MPNKRRITQGLKEIGAAWAVSADKYICTNVQCCNALEGDKAAYHVHPDASYPHQSEIIRFTSLKEVWVYIQARRAAVKARNDYADAFDCPTPDEAWHINEEANTRGARIMERFWNSLS